MASTLWGCCTNDSSKENYRFVNCTRCNKSYHFICLSISEILSESEAYRDWKCSGCTNMSQPQSLTSAKKDCTKACVKTVRNITTTRGNKRFALNSPPETAPAATSEDVRSIVQEVIKTELAIMLQQINSTIVNTVNRELAPIRKDIEDLKKSLNFHTTEFDAFKSEHDELKNTMRDLKGDNMKLQTTVVDLSQRLNYLEQHVRANNLELQCLPENKQENLYTVVRHLGSVVGCEIKDSDISHCTRIAKLNTNNARPRSIVIQFASSRIRDQLMASVIEYNKNKTHDKLNTADLGIAGTRSPVFIAEHLSPANKALHAATRIKAKQSGYKYVWTPQMIMLTFDGAVNLNNFDLYKKVFNGKIKNPNGCPIRGTFFLSHEYSNYVQVQHLAHDGHEIATGTVSQQQGLQDKGYEEWAGEMIGMREILGKFANVSRSEIVGTRAPFLKPGRNTQFKVLEDFGYIYDSSVGVPPLPIPVWPYTLDYKIAHECKSGTCPTKSFPGLWEVPFNAHYVETYEGGHCPYLDQCVLHNHDSDEVLEWLQEDFNRYYEQNRAPYMMPFHTNWFQIKELERGLHKFLKWASNEKDVWFVTVTQALTWMTDPKPVKSLNNYEAWRCDNKDYPPAPCNLPNKCALSFKPADTNFTDTRYMETCSDCPNQYPWLGDSGGTGIPGKDNYIPDNLRRK